MIVSAKLFNIFYGYSAQLIASWCRVTLNTAYQYKRGDRQPSPQARELFLLYRNRRVLGDEWDGWSINGNLLVDPEGNETTQGQLRAYYHVYQLCRELSKGREDAQQELATLMRIASENRRAS